MFSLNNLLKETNKTHIFNEIKEKISLNLNPLQKKVLLVGIAILSFSILTYHLCLYCFKAKVLDNKEENIQEDDAGDKPTKRSISQRLADNREDAKKQGEGQCDLGFSFAKEYHPKTIRTEISSIDIHGEEKTVSERPVGIASSKGFRSEMEDHDTAQTGSFQVQNTPISFDVFGVFDGHGGKSASAFMQTSITPFLKKALESNNTKELTDEGIFRAIKECFVNLDAQYLGDAGTTATVAIVLNGKIWVANVGDARTILVDKEGKTVQASEDAKPDMEKYMKKIEKLGGYVNNFFGTHRVNGILAVARAIGDKEMGSGLDNQCCISPKPKITCFPIEDFKGGHLVLACDGLYDVASTSEVGLAIHQMAAQQESAENMSRNLVYHAIQNGSKDNVSAMVIKL